MASVDISGVGSQGGGFVSGAYLSAYDLGSKSLTAPNNVMTLEYGNVTLSNGISIQGANNTDIVFSTAGIFNIVFSVQVTNNAVQDHEFFLWLCFFGNPVQNTNSILTIPSTHGGVKGHNIAAWDFMIQANIGDSYQICWSGDNTNIAIETIASPGGGIPVSPAVILSVTQV